MKKFSCLGLVVLVGCLLGARAYSAQADIEGEWALEFSGGDVLNEADMQMYVSQDGSRLTGHIEWNASASDYPLKGTITDDRFQIVWSTRVDGVVSDVTFHGTVKGDEISGTVEIAGHETADLYAHRTGR